MLYLNNFLFVIRWVFSTKSIGILYLIFGTFAVFIVTCLSLISRFDLAFIVEQFLTGNGQWNMVFITAHVLFIIFFMVMLVGVFVLAVYLFKNSIGVVAKAQTFPPLFPVSIFSVTTAVNGGVKQKRWFRMDDRLTPTNFKAVGGGVSFFATTSIILNFVLVLSLFFNDFASSYIDIIFSAQYQGLIPQDFQRICIVFIMFLTPCVMVALPFVIHRVINFFFKLLLLTHRGWVIVSQLLSMCISSILAYYYFKYFTLPLLKIYVLFQLFNPLKLNPVTGVYTISDLIYANNNFSVLFKFSAEYIDSMFVKILAENSILRDYYQDHSSFYTEFVSLMFTKDYSGATNLLNNAVKNSIVVEEPETPLTWAEWFINLSPGVTEFINDHPYTTALVVIVGTAVTAGLVYTLIKGLFSSAAPETSDSDDSSDSSDSSTPAVPPVTLDVVNTSVNTNLDARFYRLAESLEARDDFIDTATNKKFDDFATANNKKIDELYDCIGILNTNIQKIAAHVSPLILSEQMNKKAWGIFAGVIRDMFPEAHVVEVAGKLEIRIPSHEERVAKEALNIFRNHEHYAILFSNKEAPVNDDSDTAVNSASAAGASNADRETPSTYDSDTSSDAGSSTASTVASDDSFEENLRNALANALEEEFVEQLRSEQAERKRQ